MTRPSQLCQLASTWGGKPSHAGWLAEEKVDGWRALWLRDWKDRAGLYTRNGHPIRGAEHIAHTLALMEDAAGEPLFFDGEFQVDGSLAATKQWCERGWKGGQEAGQLFLFDCLTLAEWRAGRSDVPTYQRKARLQELAESAKGDGWTWREGSRGRDAERPPVVVLEDQWLSDADDVLREVNRVWAGGGEGIMLKCPDAPYLRHRCATWLKVKQGGAWMRAAA